MKIAISSTGTTKDSPVDRRFGRCKYFSVYDIDSKTYCAVTNDAQISAGGAGVQAAQNMAESGVGIVLTGNIGPKAYKALQTAGIIVITGVSGTVAEALQKLSEGDCWPSDQPTVQSHFGIND